MKSVKRIFIIFLSAVLTTSCGDPNLLTEFSETDSDEALWVDAKKHIDDLEWDSAIDIIENQLSAGYQERIDVKEGLAGAYVGKCGLTFLEIVSGMTDAPSSNLFEYFMGIFKDMELEPEHCETAIEIIQGLGTVSQRTQDQNLFLAILGIARLGVTLSYKLDQVDHDGQMDANSNVCNDHSGGQLSPWPMPVYQFMPRQTPVPAHYLNDADMRKIVSGFGLIIENLAALTAAIGNDSDTITALDDFKADCQEASGDVACDITDPDDVDDALMKYAFRVFMDTSDVGFGTCSLSTPLPVDDIADLVDDYLSGSDADDDPEPDTADDDVDVDVTGLCCPSTLPPGFDNPWD
ncbi:outer membrane protein assembly factor BamD [Bdellovibrio reynosensis]|uniref:Lipoprotein n=1 Tax=Bdellovibrio reynosensis TaxID=2835041 RepID=A0ABY4C8N1_9BACT|nr:hypothetical protein [Bdellovibrio reynosensis]UOF01089.1 hypothetical protein MNR06_15415 [Bdellovibrio reynosensis]